MTNEQRARVQQALTETHTALDRAMRYMPEFRDMDLIGFYHQHIAKLEGMLAE